MKHQFHVTSVVGRDQQGNELRSRITTFEAESELGPTPQLDVPGKIAGKIISGISPEQLQELKNGVEISFEGRSYKFSRWPDQDGNFELVLAWSPGLPEYDKMTNLQLRQAALRLVEELGPHLLRVEEDRSGFPEVKKLYDEMYRRYAVGIAKAANQRGSNADVSVIVAAMSIENPTHLRAVIKVLRDILELPDEAQKANA